MDVTFGSVWEFENVEVKVVGFGFVSGHPIIARTDGRRLRAPGGEKHIELVVPAEFLNPIPEEKRA
jgi:hypothetical protein